MDKKNNNDEKLQDDTKPEKIEIITGNGKDLNISKVYNHLNIDEPTDNLPEKHNVIIPKEKK